jgi:hypothetical protein
MIVTMVSLVISALLIVLLLHATLGSGSTSATSVSNAPGVGLATSEQAQQALSTGITAAAAAAAGAGGYGALSAASLSASDPSITFVDGPSTSASTVSVATSDAGTDGSGAGGSVTLAALASNGTCWLVWRGVGASNWYGAQTHLTSCTAPALPTTPVPSAVSASAIGWQQGSFPSA